MSMRHQAVLVSDPECFQKLPPHVLTAIDGDTANIVVEDSKSYVNFTATGDPQGVFEVVPFLESGAYAGAVDASGVGDSTGTLLVVDVTTAAVKETFTIECSNADVEGAEVWDVTGSVTGSHATAVTGVQYTTDGRELSFLITAAGPAFVAGEKTDTFTFDVFKNASYIKALRPCKLILEGVAVRTNSDNSGGFIIVVGTEDGVYGQTAASFFTGVPSPADITFCSVSSAVLLNAGEGLSMYSISGDGDTLACILQISAGYPA